MLQSLILWGTIGALLSAVGYFSFPQWDPTDWQFWCFLATYWAVGRIERAQGAGEGIIRFLNMTEAEQQKIRKLVKELDE